MMLGLSATGVLVGGLWAWIAPPIHAVVAITRAGERVHEYLGSESQNFFIAPFMLLGLLSVLAVVASALMWQWREHRGPQMVAGLSIGLTTAAAIAAELARWWFGCATVRWTLTPCHFPAATTP